MLPDKQASNSTGFTDKNAAEVLSRKHPPERKPHFSTLEAHKEMPVFSSMDMTEDVVKSVVRKRLGSTKHGGMDSESLQGWILKFGDHRKKLCISVEYFVDWLDNQKPPWAVYWEFMSGRLIVSDQLPVVLSLGIRENWRQLFSKCFLKFTGIEATHACKDDQLCAGLKTGIYGAEHSIQYIWDANSIGVN